MLEVIFDQTIECTIDGVHSISIKKIDPVMNEKFEKVNNIMAIKFHKGIPYQIKRMMQEKEYEFLQKIQKNNCNVNSAIIGDDVLNLRYDDSLDINKLNRSGFIANITIYVILFSNFNGQNITFRWKLNDISTK